MWKPSPEQVEFVKQRVEELRDVLSQVPTLEAIRYDDRTQKVIFTTKTDPKTGKFAIWFMSIAEFLKRYPATA